jgi:hypothetical protein
MTQALIAAWVESGIRFLGHPGKGLYCLRILEEGPEGTFDFILEA